MFRKTLNNKVIHKHACSLTYYFRISCTKSILYRFSKNGKKCFTTCVKWFSKLSYLFFFLHSWKTAIFLRSVRMTVHTRLSMNFRLNAFLFQGVNNRAELVPLAPGLRPERRCRRWLEDKIDWRKYKRKRKVFQHIVSIIIKYKVTSLHTSLHVPVHRFT
jgi:hypothetical protein